MIAIHLSFILHSIYCQCEEQEVTMAMNRYSLSDIISLLVALNNERTPNQSMFENAWFHYY